MHTIATSIDITEAQTIAQGAVPPGLALTDAELTHYPMTGIVFLLRASRGPASRLDGQLLHSLVDRTTGQAFSSDPWTLDDQVAGGTLSPEKEATFRLTQEDAISAARRMVATQLIKRVRLGGHFELKVSEIVEPLWKPNWYFETAKHRVLVDALNGSLAVCHNNR